MNRYIWMYIRSRDRLLFNNSAGPHYSLLLGLSIDNLLLGLSVDHLLRSNFSNFSDLPVFPDFSFLRLDIIRNIRNRLEAYTTKKNKSENNENKANNHDSGYHVGWLGCPFRRQRILHSQFNGRVRAWSIYSVVSLQPRTTTYNPVALSVFSYFNNTGMRHGRGNVSSSSEVRGEYLPVMVGALEHEG